MRQICKVHCVRVCFASGGGTTGEDPKRFLRRESNVWAFYSHIMLMGEESGTTNKEPVLKAYASSFEQKANLWLLK